MSFAIELLPDEVPHSVVQEAARWGLITIASFKERFIVPLMKVKPAGHSEEVLAALAELQKEKPVN